MHDVVRELGYLTLGTRFRRLGESLQAQAQAVLASHGMDMPAAHFPLLAALDRLGPLGVSDLSRAVGVSQPVVSRALPALTAAGWVEPGDAATDLRVRSVRLSRAGRQLVARAQRAAWPAIEAAVAQACEPLRGSLLEQLAALEAALEAAPLPQRVAASASQGRSVRRNRE